MMSLLSTSPPESMFARLFFHGEFAGQERHAARSRGNREAGSPFTAILHFTSTRRRLLCRPLAGVRRTARGGRLTCVPAGRLLPQALQPQRRNGPTVDLARCRDSLFSLKFLQRSPGAVPGKSIDLSDVVPPAAQRLLDFSDLILHLPDFILVEPERGIVAIAVSRIAFVVLGAGLTSR
jgi:hypothetical protein